MKKLTLFFAFAISVLGVKAQVTLTGTTYTQNFDGIGTGLPSGWSVYSGASTTYIGHLESFSGSPYPPSMLRPDTSCAGSVLVGGFKNYPSADVCHPGDDNCATTPPSYTNRALGVRQVSPTNTSHPNLDSGAAFVLELANTIGDTDFTMTFKLQSLDSSSPRITTWIVDYAIGATTSFTAVPDTQMFGTWTTGGNEFSNNFVTVDFKNALNNKSSNVWIRITTLVFSSGSGSRASTAIDDFSLYWNHPPISTGITNVATIPSLSLFSVSIASPDKITLKYNAGQEGHYSLNIFDLMGRVCHSQTIDTQTGDRQLSIDGLHLAPGMYFAKLNNSNSSATTRVVVQ